MRFRLLEKVAEYEDTSVDIVISTQRNSVFVFSKFSTTCYTSYWDHEFKYAEVERSFVLHSPL